MPEDRDDRSLLEIAYEGLDKLPDYPSIERSSDTLIEMLDDTADLIADMTANGPAAIGLYEGLVLAALIRSQSTIVGFLAMIEQRNKQCAQPMIRFQLDSAMRLIACLIAKEPEELIRHILDGGKPSKFKDIDGVPLNDYRLHTRLSDEYPEASRVYEDTSGYVHLSQHHLAGIWDANESRPGRLVFTRPDALPHWDELQVRRRWCGSSARRVAYSTSDSNGITASRTCPRQGSLPRIRGRELGSGLAPGTPHLTPKDQVWCPRNPCPRYCNRWPRK